MVCLASKRVTGKKYFTTYLGKINLNAILVLMSGETLGSKEPKQAPNSLFKNPATFAFEQEFAIAMARGDNQPIGYKTNVSGLSLMTRSREDVTSIPHTKENDHLILYNKSTKNFDVVYQSSAIIVDILELNLLQTQKDQPQDATSKRRALSYITKSGDFVDQATLLDLTFNVQQSEGNLAKHTARFKHPNTDGADQFSIVIDDIYCISLAPYAGDPQCWEGDNS